MKNLLWGILCIIVIGIGGFVYRNAVEHPSQPIVCPMDARMCPDGTSVARIGTSCTFASCLAPNVSLGAVDLAFAVPANFSIAALPDSASIAAYESPAVASSTGVSSIVIRRYVIAASSTAFATIQQTAISGTSGAPVSATSFTSTALSGHRFTIVSIERFEGVIDIAYYLARTTDVVRFDAIDRDTDWTNPSLDIEKLPAHAALVKLLSTLQGQ